MRILIIGAGRMGAIRLEDLTANPKASEVVVTNRNLKRAEDLAQRYSAQVIPWDEMSKSDCDAAIVAVGTDAHEQVLETILPLSIPVLCEKPISATMSGTVAMVELANQCGSPLQIGFQRRFDAAIRRVQDKVSSGELGTVYSMALMAHDHKPSPREFIAGSGGIFRDMLVHDFDLVRWITSDEIESVYATKAVRANQDYADFDDADVCMVSLKTKSGIQVSVSGTRHNPLGHDVRLEVFGSQDSVSAGLNTRTPLADVEGTLSINQDPYTGFVDRFREAFRNETAAFVDFARGEILNPCPADSAVESLRVAIACERSVQIGAPVIVSEIN